MININIYGQSSNYFKGKNVTVFRINGDSNNYYADRLQTELFSVGIFNVINRDILYTTISEKNLSMSGITVGGSDVFKVMNLDYVIEGSVESKIFKLYDVDTGSIVNIVDMSRYSIDYEFFKYMAERISNVNTTTENLITNAQNSKNEDKKFLISWAKGSCFIMGFPILILFLLDRFGLMDTAVWVENSNTGEKNK